MDKKHRGDAKAIRAYYDTLSRFKKESVAHEGALRDAFQRLLSDFAKARGWVVISELSTMAHGHSIRPDATVRDGNSLPRGYWEAKDPDDKLDAEITKKRDKDYPLTNTIFENSKVGILYQDGQKVYDADLSNEQQLTDLLNMFFDYAEPTIEQFEKAVDEFKIRVPELAKGLNDKILEAHKDNKKFKEAFDSFFTLCRTSLNPNLSEAAVDEMLVQHLLTERLICNIFDNRDFVRQNVIAAEVDKVISALTSKSFSRNDYLKSLDRFYIAIENAARGLTDFRDKQHFLNVVYERFFQGYSAKEADTLGIVYTPQPIVDFMCASVEEVLKDEFGLSLGDKNVHILDPCTGTGSFIVNLLRRIPQRDLPRMYKEQLFANEIMLLPYYVAALNIEHAYYEITEKYEPFEGLCFVDTLEMAEKGQSKFGFLTEENTKRVARQKKAPITVIIGNPPYNAGQQSENENNKNRRYPVIDKKIAETYAKASSASLKRKLYDPFVKFFRWGVDRLGDRDGIVCFVSNNHFVRNDSFDGMRKHFAQDFSKVYHIDLHGDVRENPKLSGTTHNVFGIQVGVGITVAVKKKSIKKHVINYHRVPEGWRKEEKYQWLIQSQMLSGVPWEPIIPDAKNRWISARYSSSFDDFLPLGTKEAKQSKRADVEAAFKTFSLGVSTNRDNVVYDFDPSVLAKRVDAFCEDYNAEVDRFKRAHDKVADIDKFVRHSGIKWSLMLKDKLKKTVYASFRPEAIRNTLYRPFSTQWLYLDDVVVDAPSLQPYFFPSGSPRAANTVIAITVYGRKHFSILATNTIPNLNFYGDPVQCFAFFVYDRDSKNRRDNITDWALKQFRDHYDNNKITKWDIFYYVYGILHHSGYRQKYADCLKREFPRIPFAPDFRAFSSAGEKLADIHINYEKQPQYKLDFIENKNTPLSYRVVDKMRLSKDKTMLIVNPSLTLSGIPAETFEYRLGTAPLSNG